MINIIKKIKKKGLFDFIYHGGNYCIHTSLSTINIIILRLRGYNIDLSVHLRGRHYIFQDTRDSINIDKDCEIGLGNIIRAGLGGKIILESGVALYDYTIVDIQKKLVIGKDTLISPFCYITDYDHIFQDNTLPIQKQGYRAIPITIGRNVWVGAHCIILKGVTIGNNTVLGAGSVVTHDIPSNCLAVGVPAKVIRKI